MISPVRINGFNQNITDCVQHSLRLKIVRTEEWSPSPLSLKCIGSNEVRRQRSSTALDASTSLWPNFDGADKRFLTFDAAKVCTSYGRVFFLHPIDHFIW